MNQIARRRFMSTASLSWAVAAFVSLSSVCSHAVSAQTPPVGPPPPDTTRPPVVGGLTNVPPDPLRGNPATGTLFVTFAFPGFVLRYLLKLR